MDSSPGMFAIAAVGLTVLVSSIWAWTLLIARKLRTPHEPLIPWTPRRSVPWALIDLLLLIGVGLLISVLVRQILQNWGLLPREIQKDELTIAQNKAALVGNIVASLVILLNAVILIAFRTGASLHDFGLTLKEMLPDLRLGLLGFVLLAPPVYALQGLLVRFWKPSEHPLVEMFQESPDGPFFVIVFISAALVAPLFEEIVFRVLLQGFLEKWFALSSSPYALLIGGEPRHLAPVEWESPEPLEQPAEFLDSPVTDPNPDAPPAEFRRDTEKNGTDNTAELRGMQAWLPIAISSLIFALLHYTHGPDWIPLLFLAAGMGYLYQRTHRLLPSLTVHFLLNSYSLWGLWLQVNNQ